MTKIELVAGVKAQLETHGISLVGPCGALEITKRVAWLLRSEGFGLIHKEPGQNGCNANGERYAIDAIMLRDGQTFDILISGGGDEDRLGVPIPGTGNGPAWQVTGAAPKASWRAPFDPDAGGIGAPPSPPAAAPPPPPETQVAEALRSVAESLAHLRETLVAQEGLRHERETKTDGRFALIQDQLREFAQTQARGVGNSWLLLKPPPPPTP